MHNISPTSPVLGDPLQLFPAQPRLRDVCLKVTPPGVFRSPPLSLALSWLPSKPKFTLANFCADEKASVAGPYPVDACDRLVRRAVLALGQQTGPINLAAS